MAQILPSTTAPFAPRPSKVILAMGPNDDPWLKETLKQFKTKPPPRDFQQRKTRLTEILSSNSAIWTLASIMVPQSKLSSPQLDRDPPFDTGEILHVEGHIDHINMVTDRSVIFKLTDDSINSIFAYHKNVKITEGSDLKEGEQLHQELKQAINAFVHRAPISVMEMLEVDGSGELPCGETETVKKTILGIMNVSKNLCPNSGEVLVHPLEIESGFGLATLGAGLTAWGAVSPSAEAKAKSMAFPPTDTSIAFPSTCMYRW